MFYINSICRGGAEHVILELANYYFQIGYRSILITSFVDEIYEYSVPKGVERITIELREQRDSVLSRNIRRIYALRQMCKKYKPAVLISFMGEPNLRALLATSGLATKTIVSVRSDPTHEYAGVFRFWLAKCLLPFASGAVFQTADAMRWFPERLQKKSAIIANPIADIFFETGVKETAQNIVAIGRLEKEKNFHLLIEAFAKIENRHPQEKLLIYGEGTLRESLQKQIESLRLESRVKLMGFTDDVPGVLAEAKLFVMSSDWEGMPNALLEAMAVGLSVVATDCPCGAPRMIIRDGKNGILVPVGDVDKLSAAMDKILSDSAYAGEIGKQAKQDIRASMNAEHVFSQWEEYISHILGKGMAGIACGR